MNTMTCLLALIFGKINEANFKEELIVSEKTIINFENKLEKMMFEEVRYLNRTKYCFFFQAKHVFGGNVLIKVNRDTLNVYWLYEGEMDYRYQLERSLNEVA